MGLELVGYIGSFLIGLSLTMSNIKKLRWINLFGASTFATYGVLIQAWPVLCLNGFIVLTDIYHLVKMSRTSAFYSLLPLNAQPSPYLNRFVEYYGEDIGRIFPNFSLAKDGVEGWWILRDMQPIGLFVFHRESDTEGFVDIDFVTPAFRNMKTANWFFSEGLEQLRAQGITRLATQSTNEVHQKYLRKLGFREDSSGRYARTI